MKLIKNKRIGKVLFVVEGSRHEFSLIKKSLKTFWGIRELKRDGIKQLIIKARPIVIVPLL